MRGITMSDSSVVGLVRGTKKQTRRLVGARPYKVGETLYVREAWTMLHAGDWAGWVAYRAGIDGPVSVGFERRIVVMVRGVAREAELPARSASHTEWNPAGLDIAWRPGRHMPADRARYTVTIAAARRHLLQEISEEDAAAEGVTISDAATARQDAVDASGMSPYRAAFACLWEEINGKVAPWASNPEVFAYTLRRDRSI